MSLTPEQERLKAAYVRARGYWTDWTEALLRFSPHFLDLYARYGGYPAAHGPLSARMCELIYVALDASSTHLFESGLRLHMALAVKHGATPAQVMEVLAMATEQGLGGTRVGVEILAEELQAAGRDVPELEAPLTDAQAALRDAWTGRFGDWPRHAEVLLRLDPAYFALVLDLSAFADPADRLAEADRALIRLALDACFTGLNAPALREGMRHAIRLGIDWRAILQVLQMTAHLGVHACAIGGPALAAIVDRRTG
ncbi:MAG: carboxymuconolactone decarboxylase family protein [Rhodospirillales bacterium]|nr:carboxymuconolactone decarboxylase family protein [Rhodospirillales bacterium]